MATEKDKDTETKPATVTIEPAEARNTVKRGRDVVTDEDYDVLPSYRKRVGSGGSPGGWSHEDRYAKASNGGTSVAAREADRDRARRQNMDEGWEFRKKYGMFKADYDRLQRVREEIKARDDRFVAGARQGKFNGNIYLSGKNWNLLASALDENGNLKETVNLGSEANAKAMKDLAAWAASLNANDGSRYGGRYNMNALPKGIFIRDKDGNWKVNESMITSQAQVNALLQMKAQDDSRQGRWKAEQAERQGKVDADNRKFLTDRTAYDPEDVKAMSSEQLAAEVGAIRQENVETGIREGDENRVREYGGTASQQNRAAGRPDTQAEFDKAIDWNNPVDFDNLPSGEPKEASAAEPESIPPATPKDQSPKTSASPKVTEEEDR